MGEEKEKDHSKRYIIKFVFLGNGVQSRHAYSINPKMLGEWLDFLSIFFFLKNLVHSKTNMLPTIIII